MSTIKQPSSDPNDEVNVEKRAQPRAIDRVTPEIKALIANFVPPDDAISLACVSREWQDVAEKVTWKEVGVKLHPEDCWSLEPIRGDYLNESHASYGLASRWRRFEDNLASRPERAGVVQSLHIQGMLASASSISRVLCSLPHIQFIRHSVKNELSGPTDPGVIIIGLHAHLVKVGGESTLRSIEVHLPRERAAHADLGEMLGRLPHLEHLRLLAPAGGNISIAGSRSQRAVLPRLTSLEIVCDTWTEDGLDIARVSPMLDRLRVDRRTRSNRYRTPVAAFCEEVMVRHLEVADRAASEELVWHLNAHAEEPWLPELRTLLIYGGTVSRGLIMCPPPRFVFVCTLLNSRPFLDDMAEKFDPILPLKFSHPTLDALCIVVKDHWQRKEFMATRPSSQVTGYLSPWVAGLLDRNPSLARLSVLARYHTPSPEYDEWLGYPYTGDEQEESGSLDNDEGNDITSAPAPVAGWLSADERFLFRTFSRPSGPGLYHARHKVVQASMGMLCPHALAYEPQAIKSLSHNWILKLKGMPVHGDGQEDMDRGAAEVTDEWIDITSFDGYPLPKTLLVWVYTFVDETDPHKPVVPRDAGLPDVVWEVLDGWRKEVEESVGERKGTRPAWKENKVAQDQMLRRMMGQEEDEDEDEDKDKDEDEDEGEGNAPPAGWDDDVSGHLDDEEVIYHEEEEWAFDEEARSLGSDEFAQGLWG